MKSKNAFTLIELLVTVAIIAVLAALLLPALAKAKSAAQRSQCTSNIREWAIAMHIYLIDNGDFFPRENAVDGPNSWYMATNSDVWYNVLATERGVKPLSDYATLSTDQSDFYERRSLFHCPVAKFSPVAMTYPNFSLAMNSKLILPGSLTVSYGAIVEPVSTPFFVESGVPGEATVPCQNPYNGQPHCYASRFSARHDNGGNLAMADGHVSWFPASKIVSTNGKSIWPPVDVVWCPTRSTNPNR